MYKVIMAPTEGLDTERHAISVATRLAQRFDAELRLVRVQTAPIVLDTPGNPVNLAAVQEALRDTRLARRRKLEALGAECRALGEIRVITALEDGAVTSTLGDYARRFNVDLIVMSSHARGGVSRIALGSVADYLIRQADIPVLIVKRRVTQLGGSPGETFNRIVVPLDGSASAKQILPQVAALASRLNATVSLLHVLTPVTYSQKQIMQSGLPWWDTDIAIADEYLTRAGSYLSEVGVPVSKDVVLSENVPSAILDYASRSRADLIAIASSGAGGIGRFVFGSVADEVTRKSQTSILVFHPKRTAVETKDNERLVSEPYAGV
jgi:nucleotide-binding universal stress UspA family protein